MNGRLRLLPLVLLTVLVACDKGGGGGSSPPIEPPPKPEYERAFDEFSDIPTQMTRQVEWAAEPIDSAVQLADEIAALRAKVNMDPAAFKSLFTVAFEGGTIEIGAVTQAQDVKAELEATLAKVQQVGKDLAGIPGRAKTAGQQISKMVLSTPKLVLKSTKELSGSLGAAVGDGAVKIQADLDTVKKLPAEVKTQAMAAKDVLAELPAKAQQATTNLMAAMAGEPYTPLETTKKDAGAAESGEPGTPGTPSGSGTPAGETPTALADVSSAPPNTPPAIISARIFTLEQKAATMGKYGDWWSAADAFEEALRLAPQNHIYRFQIGDAARKAKDCPRAQTNFKRFLEQADPNANPTEIQLAKKALGELKTFDCPVRTAADQAAAAETSKREAKLLIEEGDVGGAAVQYAMAFQQLPTDVALAFEVGVTAWKAHACSDAVRYFYRVMEIGDPKTHRKQIQESDKYIARAEVGECKPLPAEQADTLARTLYDQAQTLELALDFLGAAGKYERAYDLLPSNPGFAFRIAESYWANQSCESAKLSYQRFAAVGTDPRYEEEQAKSKEILGRIATHGCPNALWNTSISSAAAAAALSKPAPTSGPGPGPVPEAKPPETAEGGAGSARCSVQNETPVGGLALGLFVLAYVARRRRSPSRA